MKIKHLSKRLGEGIIVCSATHGVLRTRFFSFMSSADPSLSVRHFTVDENAAGQRLDNFLIRQLKGVPKTHIYRIIRSGEVRRNKSRVAADDRLALGDTIRVPPVRTSAAKAFTEAPATLAQSPELPVVHEDDGFLALNKPAGLAVHGGSGVSWGVIELLRAQRPQSRFLELVHRLDRDTSGLLLVAKKKSALTALQDQFRQRSTGKTYLALVKGQWPASKRRLDAALMKYELPDGERRVKVVPADHPQALASLSFVRRLAHWPTLMGQNLVADGCSLVAVTIKTGRTHQIRVHLSHAGYPIVGDDKYGDFELNRQAAKAGLRRMFLHAWRLQLIHPATEQTMQFEARLPQDLRLTEFLDLGVELRSSSVDDAKF